MGNKCGIANLEVEPKLTTYIKNYDIMQSEEVQERRMNRQK